MWFSLIYVVHKRTEYLGIESSLKIKQSKSFKITELALIADADRGRDLSRLHYITISQNMLKMFFFFFVVVVVVVVVVVFHRRLYWVDKGYIYRSGVDGSDLTRLDIDSGSSSFFVTPKLILVYKVGMTNVPR